MAIKPSNIFTVERLLDIRESQTPREGSSNLQVLIEWRGYGPQFNTWEDLENLSKGEEGKAMRELSERVSNSVKKSEFIKKARVFLSLDEKTIPEKMEFQFSETKKKVSSSPLIRPKPADVKYLTDRKMLQDYPDGHDKIQFETLTVDGKVEGVNEKTLFSFKEKDTVLENEGSTIPGTSTTAGKTEIKYSEIDWDPRNRRAYIYKSRFEPGNSKIIVDTERVLLETELEGTENRMGLLLRLKEALNKIWIKKENFDKHLLEIANTHVNLK